jgi:hypothetical protein
MGCILLLPCLKYFGTCGSPLSLCGFEPSTSWTPKIRLTFVIVWALYAWGLEACPLPRYRVHIPGPNAVP